MPNMRKEYCYFHVKICQRKQKVEERKTRNFRTQSGFHADLLFYFGPYQKDTVSKHCDVLACVETWFVSLKVRQPLQLSLVLLLCC